MEPQLDAASRVGVASSGQPKFWTKTYSLPNRTLVKNTVLSKEKEMSRLVKGTIALGSALYKVTKRFATAGMGELMLPSFSNCS